MKIYTAEFECSTPSPRKFWTAPRSDIAIGVKISEKGVSLSGVTLTPDGGSALAAESDKVAGYTVFKVNSGATGSVGYTAAAQGKSFRLTQIVTDSTVFEVNAGGGSGPVGDYATQAWVQNQLTAYATTEDLGDYATQDYVDQEVSSKADASALTAYAAKADVDACVKLSAQSVQAVSGDLSASTVLAPAYMLSSATYGQSRPYDSQIDGVLEEQEDPDTGDIIQVWVPDDPENMKDPSSKGYWYDDDGEGGGVWMKSYDKKDSWDQIKAGNESDQGGLGQYVHDVANSYSWNKVAFGTGDSVAAQRIRAVYEDDWASISADQDYGTLYVVLSGNNPDSEGE